MALKRIEIPKQKLADLYITKKLSTAEIAKMYNCSHATILNRLKLYGIETRSTLGTRRPVSIPKETLIDLYVKKRLTQVKIAKKFGHSRYGIQRKMKQYGIKSRSLSEAFTKHSKKNFAGGPMEKAYLTGFRLGDLNVYKSKYPRATSPHRYARQTC